MNIHLFTFIRNEAYLLRRWIPYHSLMIDLGNIHVIDHKSDDPDCISLLNRYEKKGMDVKKTSIEFRKKYKLLTQLMHKYKSEADILIPLDADEFLCLAEEDGEMNADPVAVSNYLHSLPINGKKYAFHVFESVLDQVDYKDPLLEIKKFRHFPALPDASGPNQQTKTFFPAKNFGYTDQGNHKGNVLLAPNDIYNTSKMAMAHFHMRGFSHFQKKLKKAIDAFNLTTLPPDYVGIGMRWNRWYHETKDLDPGEKKEWFEKKFVVKDGGKYHAAISNTFKSLTNIT